MSSVPYAAAHASSDGEPDDEPNGEPDDEPNGEPDALAHVSGHVEQCRVPGVAYGF